MILNSGLYIDIQIGDYSNFLEFKDLINLNMIESAGIVLPRFEISFRTLKSFIKDKIIENNKIVVKMGVDKNNFDSFTVSVLSKKIEENSEGYFSCYAIGFLIDKKFLIDKMIRSVKGTSLGGLKQISSEYFKSMETDIESVNETPQNWILTNNNNQKLATDMWTHMDIAPSFPLLAVTRKGTLLVKDFNKLKQSKPKYIFVQKESKENNDEIIYLNNFDPDNYTHVNNLYAGYGKFVNIFNRDTGKEAVYVNESTPNLAATQEVEISKSGNKILNGFIESNNVHDTFHKSYFYNTSKLVQLSNIQGALEFKGIYKKDLNLLDLVYVQPNDSDKYKTLSGKYVVNTIEYNLTAQTPFSTTVYVCRDSLNNIENSIVDKDNNTKITVDTIETILEQTRVARRSMSVVREYIGNDTGENILTYLTSLKYCAMNSFSSFGINVNFNSILSQLNVLDQLKSMGKNLLNEVLSKAFPPEIMSLLQVDDWESNLNLMSLLEEWLVTYIPSEFLDFYRELILTLDSLKTNITKTTTYVQNNQKTVSVNNIENIGNAGMLSNSSSVTTEKINNIISALLNNVKGLDVPVPVIEVTESSTLYNDEQLNKMVEDDIVDNLNKLGYLKDVDEVYFRQILTGEKILDYNTIQQINLNTGTAMYIRHYGSFKEVYELTDFFVRKSYKEKFKTPYLEKTIDAHGGKKIFIALPSFITGLKFSINSKEVSMNTTEIDLRYFDNTNNKVMYTIYYTDAIYNSNSVLCKVVKN